MTDLATSPDGRISIAPAALARLVVRAAERVPGARARRPKRGVEVSLADAGARVRLELAVRAGEPLPEVARAVQEEVAGALRAMCGVGAVVVDVSVEELEP